MTGKSFLRRLLITVSVGALFASYPSAMAQTAGSHGSSILPSPEYLGAKKGQNIRGFGRLFSIAEAGQEGKDPDALQPHPSPRYDLLRLGREMFGKPEDAEVKSLMPLAYVFLGQFIDHDLTLDTVTGFDQLARQKDLENARTPELDLDCVYGGGPERTPFLFDGPYLRAGVLVVHSDAQGKRRHDLHRAPAAENAKPVALIGDPRNDENFIVSQLQAAFIAYHNRIVDRLLHAKAERLRKLLVKAIEEGDASNALAATADKSEAVLTAKAYSQLAADGQSALRVKSAADVNRIVTPDFILRNQTHAEGLALLEEARNIVIHQYHRMILEDFLPRIIGVGRVLDILENGRDFYFPEGFLSKGGEPVAEPFIPIEFAVAAYRFGHSQVPAELVLRDNVGATIFGKPADGAGDRLGVATVLEPRGFDAIRRTGQSLAIDWRRLIDLKESETGTVMQRARRLDPKLAMPLMILADRTIEVVGTGGEGNLASRNLSRGRTYRLPSGQDLACKILARLDERGALQRLYKVKQGDERSIRAYRCDDRSATAYDRFVLQPDPTTRQTLAIRETPLWYYILQEADEFGAPFDAFLTREGREKYSRAFSVEMEAVSSRENTALRRTTPDQADEHFPIRAYRIDPDDRNSKELTGRTLGPVGATIVGETLIGLIDHYREKTGHGLYLNVPLTFGTVDYKYQWTDETGASIEPGSWTELTETPIEISVNDRSFNFGRRYLLRNFLIDAGVADAIDERNVCKGEASKPC